MMKRLQLQKFVVNVRSRPEKKKKMLVVKKNEGGWFHDNM
jgi:hypothetical protein